MSSEGQSTLSALDISNMAIMWITVASVPSDNVFGIGRRIIVRGPTGSGKTTLASQVAERIDVPLIGLDSTFWQSRWAAKPMDELRADVYAAIQTHKDAWVCDGNYHQTRTVTLPEADTVIWLRLPFRVAAWRLLERTIRLSRNREVLWGTKRESWRKSFLNRKSILLWLATHWMNASRANEARP